jgi:Protein of unknown function (DUF1264)
MNRRDLLAQLGALSAGLAAVNASPADDTAGKTARHTVNGPLGKPHAHFCGIHMAKNNPKLQFVTQHYCVGQSDGLFQCLLYDAATEGAKLIGIEYIVTDDIFRKLPDTEKKYWHPHTYEVLAGGLVAPGMTEENELAFMKTILTTWGKTWHTWPDPTTPVPMGEPLLIWSLMGDGQADEKVIAARDRDFGVSTAGVRAKRIKQFGMEPPKVDLPKSMDTIGRQWTNTGDDKPAKR